MKISEYLVKMLGILSGPTKWTKGELFKDVDGKPVESERSKRISSCCLMGCMYLSSRSPVKRVKIEEAILESNPEICSISYWNDRDERTYGDVKKVIRNAIKHAQKLEKE